MTNSTRNNTGVLPFQLSILYTLCALGALGLFIVRYESFISSSLLSTLYDGALFSDKTPNITETTSSNNGENILDANYYLTRLDKSLEKLQQRMELDYGSYHSALLSPSVIETFLSTTNRQRFVRRLQIKFLKNIFLDENTTNATTNTNTLVWVTGGHSSAAGHGNLMNETYTYFVEDTVKDVFSSVGIPFEARNRAMGGMGSAPELSMCQSAIYGPDVDILLWDFGMTDGRNWHYIDYWANRAGVLLGRPILFGKDGGRSERRARFATWEDRGITTVNVEKSAMNQLLKTVLPDATKVDQTNISRAVRNFVCAGNIESGGSPCDEAKYDTKELCNGRDVKFHANWHPGWKMHMFHGRVYGYFLTTILREAITAFLPVNKTDTTNSTPEISQYYLDNLLEMEKQDEKLFTQSESSYDIEPNKEYKDVMKNLSTMKAICHTSYLPSYSRYHDISCRGNFSGYDIRFGIPRATRGDRFPLIYEKRLRQEPCGDVPLQYDYKDYFLVRQGKKNGITLPNDKEVNVFGDDGSNKASVMICLKKGDWGQNKADYMKADELNNPPKNNATKSTKRLSILINSEETVNFKYVGETCFVLKNADGIHWKYSSEERLKIQFKIFDKYMKLYITSIIIFLS